MLVSLSVFALSGTPETGDQVWEFAALSLLYRTEPGAQPFVARTDECLNGRTDGWVQT